MDFGWRGGGQRWIMRRDLFDMMVMPKHTPDDIAALLIELRSEHRDLDRAIARLADDPAVDQLQLSRLKKRKLRLKDQIAYWESCLIPDLDA